MEESGNMASITGQNHIQNTSVNTLPTKTTNYQTSKQGSTNPSGKFEKNDTLRSQLRKSYDANAGSLPHPHGIQPLPNYEKGKLQNRPHSSTKINSQIGAKQGVSAISGNQL